MPRVFLYTVILVLAWWVYALSHCLEVRQSSPFVVVVARDPAAPPP